MGNRYCSLARKCTGAAACNEQSHQCGGQEDLADGQPSSLFGVVVAGRGEVLLLEPGSSNVDRSAWPRNNQVAFGVNWTSSGNVGSAGVIAFDPEPKLGPAGY
jgi:hypothetical protein